MAKNISPKQIEEINLDRASSMAKTLIGVGGFPVLICGVIPGVEGNQLVTFSFSGADKAEMREMLLDYLKHLDSSNFHVPAGYGG